MPDPRTVNAMSQKSVGWKFLAASKRFPIIFKPSTCVFVEILGVLETVFDEELAYL